MVNRFLRVRQRGRFGLPALDPAIPPSSSEMMIDKLVVTITARLWHPSGVEYAVSRYRDLMASRPATPLGEWSHPTRQAHKFTMKLDRNKSTISAFLACQNELKHARIRLNLILNPTRTLVHALATAEDHGASHDLHALQTDEFFCRHTNPKSAHTDNGNDNAIGLYADAKASLRGPIAESFLPTYEEKLKDWVMSAVAPLELGFVQQCRQVQPVATLDGLEIVVEWDKLLVKEAEAYFERRHATARQVIARLAARMTSTQTGTTWTRYPLEEHGGAHEGVMSVGFKPTNDIRQAYYAKCKDRIRIETRYDRRIRNSLRYPETDASQPLTSILNSLLINAAHRARYAAFCGLIAEPDTFTVHDIAEFIATVAQCAVSKRVPVGPVISSLLSTGSLDKTDPEGAAPERLIDALCIAGILDREPLSRNRPGDPERYGLTGAYHEAVRRLQDAFQ